MLQRLDLRGLAGHQLAAALPRPAGVDDAPVAAVREIIAAVREGGDTALRELTKRFDGADIDDLRVAPPACQDALDGLAPDLRQALEVAAASIVEYHRAQIGAEVVHERDGLVVREMVRPVDRAGLYVPGGRAAYPSTVLMCSLPALVAGVGSVALCVPPASDGSVPAVTLAAAAIGEVGEVYRVGGAQAIAALAYGTESIRPVDVIVGPGNIYVATAQREVAGQVGVPSAFAGPSEVVVVADGSVPAALVAVDVALQAEHGPGGLAWLVTWSEDVVDAVLADLDRLVAASPRRADLEATLGTQGYVALVDGPDAAIEVANAVAPEHLELLVADPEALLPAVRHAGAVFCGPWTPASLGDYIAGPNHVLPTAGTARFGEALRVDDFRKHVHVVTADQGALARLGPHVIRLAEAEGLPAHADSIRRRLP